MFLLVFCYSFPITHSDYFTPLLEVHQRHPNGLREKIEILTIAKEVLQDLTRAFLSAPLTILTVRSPYLYFVGLLSVPWTSVMPLTLCLSCSDFPSPSCGQLILSFPQ